MDNVTPGEWLGNEGASGGNDDFGASRASHRPGEAALGTEGRELRRPFGVYVHFPWCLVKCPYCDFVAFKRRPDRIPHAAYADAVLTELEARAGLVGRCAALRSVFFGGGTPSLWRAGELGRVRRAIASTFQQWAGEELEVSVECDPVGLDAAAIADLVEAGVNRLSIGVQALDDGRLNFLGRAHDARQARIAVSRAAELGVQHVSADLIFGLPGLSPERAADEAAEVVSLGATHVSAYALTIESQTVFGKLARKGRLPLADDGAVAESFLAVSERLTALGFEHYEVSNHAAPGHRSVHNVGYWVGHEYLGLGCGAVGLTRSDGGGWRRYRNQPHPERYLEALRAADLERCTHEEEHLDGATRLRERIMLGLRLADGLDLESAAAECDAEAWPPGRREAVARLEQSGRLVRIGKTLKVPQRSFLWVDGTAALLF